MYVALSETSYASNAGRPSALTTPSDPALRSAQSRAIARSQKQPLVAQDPTRYQKREVTANCQLASECTNDTMRYELHALRKHGT